MKSLLKFASLTASLFLAACSTPIGSNTDPTANYAPQITLNSLTNQATKVSLTATVKDPEGDALEDCTISWGDGKTDSLSAAECAKIDKAHTYASEGLYLAKITATDSANQTSTQTVSVVASSSPVTTPITTNPKAPQILALTQDDNNLDDLATAVTYTLQKGTAAGELTCEINWGDGGEVAKSQPCSASSANTVPHTYIAAGMYTVTLTVTDTAGAKVSASVGVRVGKIAQSQWPNITMFQKSAPVNPDNTTNEVVISLGTDNLPAGTTCRLNWGDGLATAKRNPDAQKPPFEKLSDCPTALRDITYNYDSPGDYAVLFEADTPAGDHFSKTLGVKVRRFDYQDPNPLLALSYSVNCTYDQVYYGELQSDTKCFRGDVFYKDGRAVGTIKSAKFILHPDMIFVPASATCTVSPEPDGGLPIQCGEDLTFTYVYSSSKPIPNPLEITYTVTIPNYPPIVRTIYVYH